MTSRAKERLGEFAFVIAIGALFPRSGYRRSAKRVILGVVGNTALLFAIRQWLAPWAKRQREETRAELREELGREPTPDEIVARWSGRDHAEADCGGG